jgi:predicted Zn-dependent peptidase
MLREKLGLTYSVTSALVERRAAKALLICSRVRATETTNATRLMLEELAGFARSPPTAEELEPVRAMAITEAETAQDELSGIVEAWRRASVMKLAAPAESEVAELRKVTVAELVAISKKLSTTETVQVIFSGERPLVEAAARANGLGALKVPTLGRVTE